MRTRNWDVKLAAFRERVREEPYEWGTTDCGSLVRRGVAVVYGLAPWLPPGASEWYSSLKGARQVYEDLGGFEGVLRGWGAEQVGRRFASAGDVLVRPKSGGWGEECGILVGGRVLSSRPNDGVVLEPWRPQDVPEYRVFRLPPDKDPWGADAAAVEERER